MIKEFGFIFISFFIAYIAFVGILGILREDYGFQIGLGESVFVSSDKGENWLAIEDVENESVGGRNLVFDPRDSDNIYLASVNGIFQSGNSEKENKDKKDEKKKFKKEKEIKLDKESSIISEFIYNPENTNVIYIVSEEIGRNKLFISYDKGNSFEPIFVSRGDGKISSFAIDPFLSTKIYIGTKDGIFLESTDNGKSWKERNKFGRMIEKIKLNPQKQGEIYIILAPVSRSFFDYYNSAEIPRQVFLSKDMGKNFENLSKEVFYNDEKGKNKTFPEIKNIVFDKNNNQIYFVSDFSILKLRNGKITELKIISASDRSKINAFTISPKNSNILYVGIGEIIYSSFDAGRTWQIIESPKRGNIKDIKVNPLNVDNLLISIEKIF